eukprot:3731278-Rhodomonas_salina.1
MVVQRCTARWPPTSRSVPEVVRDTLVHGGEYRVRDMPVLDTVGQYRTWRTPRSQRGRREVGGVLYRGTDMIELS